MSQRFSDDVDLVLPTQYAPTAPGTIPPPREVPEFTPLLVSGPQDGAARLPPDVNNSSPIALFSLFFNQEVIQQLCKHTNEYAEQCQMQRTRLQTQGISADGRPWWPVSPGEMRAYLATCIHMSVTRCLPIPEYWAKDRYNSYSHAEVVRHIAKTRWEQIHRYLHVSGSELTLQGSASTLTPRHPKLFHKLEPLNSFLRDQFRRFWRPGRDLAVDEAIQRFTGRSDEVVNIPSKPTPEGFKIWILANQGYVLDWLFHSKGKHGPIDIDEDWVNIEGFTRTEAVVLDLATQGLDNQKHYLQENQHVIWLDNLFTSVNLLTRLRELGYGAAGTVRTTQTQREKEERPDDILIFEAAEIDKQPKQPTHPNHISTQAFRKLFKSPSNTYHSKANCTQPWSYRLGR